VIVVILLPLTEKDIGVKNAPTRYIMTQRKKKTQIQYHVCLWGISWCDYFPDIHIYRINRNPFYEFLI
jgi:hypothetical protein